MSKSKGLRCNIRTYKYFPVYLKKGRKSRSKVLCVRVRGFSRVAHTTMFSGRLKRNRCENDRIYFAYNNISRLIGIQRELMRTKGTGKKNAKVFHFSRLNIFFFLGFLFALWHATKTWPGIANLSQKKNAEYKSPLIDCLDIPKLSLSLCLFMPV